MSHVRPLAVLFAAAALAAAPSAARAADTDVLKGAVKGTPAVQSVDVINFAPGGVLLIGDGKGKQIFAVQAEPAGGKPDTAKAASLKLDGIDAKLGAAIGTDAKGIEILDLATGPVTGTVYIAVRRQDDKRHVILTVDAAGKVGEFSLKDVPHVRIALPGGEKSTLNRVTDVAWAGDRLLAAGRSSEEFACKMFAVPGPLADGAEAAMYAAETYHVAHRKWETKAPMQVIMPFRENGKTYVVGSFNCTPVVKYPVDDVKPGAVIKGVSVLELGSGNQPLDMFTYEKAGKAWVLVNVNRFHHARAPYGPSPYCAIRIDRGILTEQEKINEKATLRLAKPPAANAPTDGEQIKLVDTFHGVMHMDKLGETHAVVIRKDVEKGTLSLEVLELP